MEEVNNMPEKCIDPCAGLTRLEQEVMDVRKQNGADHKEIRDHIQKIERDEARQEGRLDNIVNTLNDIKVDNKEIIGKLNPLVNKLGDMDKLQTDVDDLKSKPGKKWEKISFEILMAVVMAAVAFLLGRIGL